MYRIVLSREQSHHGCFSEPSVDPDAKQEPSMTMPEAAPELIEVVEQLSSIVEKYGGWIQKLEAQEAATPKDSSAFAFSIPDKVRSKAWHANRPPKAAPLPLPDPRLIRRIIRQRRFRERHFGGRLFADPAWDILLDLTAARAEHKRVSVSSLCIASAVPPTTALRWIGLMVEAGLLHRQQDDLDNRRAFISLTDHAARLIACYFDAICHEPML